MAKAEKEIEPDQEPGTTHPRKTHAMVGHLAAEQELMQALTGSRPHHAWMLTGPKGVGKATLAYRAARVLLGARQNGLRPFDTDEDDPIATRIAAGSHPDLLVVRRSIGKNNKLRQEIVVDDARALTAFFAMQPAEGGWRVAVIDCVDELNRNAANALLKSLEEPPARALVLLICHAPGGALVTIRSRCRRLALGPLGDAEITQCLNGSQAHPVVLRLAGGAPGRAIALQAGKADEVWDGVCQALSGVLKGQALAFGPLARVRAPLAERFDLILAMSQHLARIAAAPENEDDRRLIAGLSDASRSAAGWAQAWSELGRLREQVHGLGLNPVHAITRIGIVFDSALRQHQSAA